MRTTLNTIYNMIQGNLNKVTTDMAKINSQISSGRQMSKISDNPVNLVSALGMRSSLAELEQYQENLIYGESIITASESALSQMKDQVIEARTTTIQALNAPLTQEDRLNIAPTIRNLIEQAVTLGNTQISGKYIFGGYRTTGYSDAEPAPFVEDLIDGYRINSPQMAFDAADTPPTFNGAGDLKINGIDVPDVLSVALDTDSTLYPESSALAKANAINNISDQTGVTAEITPAIVQATIPVAASPPDLETGDLIINDIDIFSPAYSDTTSIAALDNDHALINAINTWVDDTGVAASLDSNGALQLKAVDGRNIRVQTSDDGEAITSINDTGTASDHVYIGGIQLHSDRSFMLEATDPATEEGLAALDLDSGSSSGEPAGVRDNGRLSVVNIEKQDSNVRYTGDRENNLEIKVGKTNTLRVSRNGQEAVMDSGLFSSLIKLEDNLLGRNYTQATSIYQVTDTTAALDSGVTGLDPDRASQFANGSFSITVTDHEHYPPEDFTVYIPVDITDSFDSIAGRIDNIPNINASWNSDGYLEIQTSDPDRYTMSIADQGSNFLETVGITDEKMQFQALSQSLTDLDDVMTALTTHISDFGARANRIDVQSQIYTNLEIATQENLSEKQDTDMLEAIMDLKAKEVAYQAALSAASKTMQLSLVDYL
jgi:flagellin-like hook-associated protein FlgL